jgi:hypothetical protein
VRLAIDGCGVCSYNLPQVIGLQEDSS